jgi:hypothetical protein
MDENLYQNDGATYQDQDFQPKEPQQQTIDRQEELEKFAASYPIIQDVIAWFETEIANATSTDNIQFDTITVNGVTIEKKLSIEVQVYALHMLKLKLIDKYGEFKELKAND